MFYITKDKCFDENDTIEFIKLLTSKVENISLFWDNASIHKSKVVTRYIKRNKLKAIYNIPYEP